MNKSNKIINLIGHFSYIDDRNKLIFVFDDDKSKQKLINTVDKGTNPPFDEKEFRVLLPTGYKDRIPDDIRSLVGLRVSLSVSLKYYTFSSRQKYNFGEKISGIQLILEDIKQIARADNSN